MDVATVVIYILIVFIAYKIIMKVLQIPWISNLDSRYILITGCSTGFGNALAKRLDVLGCHVIATCRTKDAETELCKTCSKKLHTIHLDVSNSESVRKAYEEVIDLLPAGKG